MLDFINGNKFADLSHFVIDIDKRELVPKLLQQNAIIFCKTDYLNLLFDYIRFSPYKYILITHMSDYPIDLNIFSLKPNCVKKWFAENAIHLHSDLISLPIGLENHEGSSKGYFTNHKWYIDNIDKLRKNKKDRKTLYCNWNINNNMVYRKDIIPKLQTNLEYLWECKLSFETYCENMSKYKFVISPPGNGPDCHRTWEALYMGCIPIVIKNRIYREYNLPILQVNDYSEVTYELLERFLEKKINKEMMFMSYWKNKILEKFQNLNE